MNSMKFSVNTLGCKTNLSESDYIINSLQKRGYRFVSYKENPDFCIVNTCTVTSRCDGKVRQIIRRIRYANPDSTIIVAGCYVVFNKEFLKDSKIDYLIENKDKLKIPDLIDKLALNKARRACSCDVNFNRDKDRYRNITHARPLIKIQDGCEQNCSYCIIPKVRGRYKSTPPKDILEQIRDLRIAGFDEIVLTGIHIGKYGVDFNVNSSDADKNSNKKVSNLADLLEEIIKHTDVKRIRLGSIEINEIDDRIVNLIRDSGRIAPHLHIALQSGSNKVLKLMRRPYDRDYFLERVKTIKKSIPDVVITTDVMVGFPGEEEEDFLQTIDLIRRVSFSKLHVFKYSPRMYTAASKMEKQVPEIVKSKRSKRLRNLGNKLRENYIKKNIGKILEIVPEKIDIERKMVSGISQNYIRVYFLLDGSGSRRGIKKGRLVKVVAKSEYKDGLWGVVKM